jgi:uncharacterized phage-associated protein
MAAASQIAEWIIRYRAENGAPIDPISLQKMLYYAQAFRLARQGEPLFRERFKAWVHGPVIPQVWKRFPSDPSHLIMPEENGPKPQVDDSIEEQLRDVVDYFSRRNPFTISEATHNEDPWREARGSRAWYEPSDEPIPTERIKSYYAGLLSDGEEALSRHEALDVVPEPRLGIYYQAGICVRRMTKHPFYRMDWAEALLRPIAPDPKLPSGLFAPLSKREFLSASEL